jgi:16S rRNA processing protein RimM
VGPETGGRARPDHLVVGQVSKAHGTKGELFVWPLTDHAATVFAAGAELLLGDEQGVADADAEIVRVVESRPFKRGLLVKLDGVGSREDADALARRYLLLPADAVPPLAEGEVFYHELLGMAVETVDGAMVGEVREVFETEPHHLLEVKGEGGRLHLIPFAERIVRTIDVEAKRLVIDPPDGLLEL